MKNIDVKEHKTIIDAINNALNRGKRIEIKCEHGGKEITAVEVEQTRILKVRELTNI